MKFFLSSEGGQSERIVKVNLFYTESTRGWAVVML